MGLSPSQIAYLKELEDLRPSNKATGIYRTRLPSQPKQRLDWKQPIARNAPVYQFEIKCPYCGREVVIKRFSPRAPQHCGRSSCQLLYERKLVRVRKQRQREREKNQKTD